MRHGIEGTPQGGATGGAGMTIRAISLGAGVQSTALLVLAAQREIDFPLAIFANVGDDSENPATIDYMHEYAIPYAAANGIELVTVRHEKETLYQKTMRQSGVSIPMRLPNTGAPAARGCTRDFKVAPIARELKRRGATRNEPATVALGISIDEWHRMKDSTVAHEVFAYPLVDRRMDRAACEAVIVAAGLPVPPKSSCWFCPWTSPTRWRSMMRNDPDTFARAVQFERDVNAKPGGLTVWLTDALKPLDEAIQEDGQMELFNGPTCDIGGYCHA